MKYIEFKERIEVWGKTYDYRPIVETNRFHTLLKVGYDGEYKLTAVISNLESFTMITYHFCFNNLREESRKELFKIVTEYAATKLEDREAEKKYYLRLPIYYDNEWNYLKLERDTGKYFIRNKKEVANYQTKFTTEEIEKLREKYNLDSFEIVEVE